MKKHSIRLFTIILSLMVIPSITAAEIKWEDSREKAMIRAKHEGKNILVLITAPDWCGWCIRFEEEILSQPDIQLAITSNYIPLRLLDEVDDERNPELVNFLFSGFPTVRIYDTEGGLVEDIYTLEHSEFLNHLEELVYSTGNPEPALEERYILSGSESGRIVRTAINLYEIKLDSAPSQTFKITSRDESYFYIFNEETEDYIAMPYGSGFAGICNYNSGNWTEWEQWLVVEPETESS